MNQKITQINLTQIHLIMKNVISMVALVAFLFTTTANAQEETKKQKKAKAKTEKSCATEEKKSCATEKKASCCSAKKAETK